MRGGNRSWLRAVANEAIDWLMPELCAVCNERTSNAEYCAKHAIRVRVPGARCVRCAARLADGVPDGERCAGCRRRPPGVAQTVIVGDYRGELREQVLALKHAGRKALAQPLGLELGRAIAAKSGSLGGRSRSASPSADVFERQWLVPMPLHPLRRIERGHDQALALALHAQQTSGIHCLAALVRKRGSPAQGSLFSASRARSVRGAFATRRLHRTQISGSHVWLIDDVATSMSTARESARALRRAGARRVSLAVLARAATQHGRRDAL